ncbi:MAG TPA: hypothetical protein VNZ06_11445, partial [Steroidobacteraceae bacterium]|nr:hypothetical protein [Steroidobacteraceae bacterium]
MPSRTPVMRWSALLAAAFGTCQAKPAGSAEPPAMVLHAARLLDVATGRMVTPGEVLVQGQR